MGSAAAATEHEITFRTAVESTRLSIAYRLGLVITAVVMLVLPLLYIALIGAALVARYLALEKGINVHLGTLDAGRAAKLVLRTTVRDPSPSDLLQDRVADHCGRARCPWRRRGTSASHTHPA
jgi:hypothetical protein